MIKLICLFALVAVTVASTVQLSTKSFPMHMRRVRAAEVPAMQKDTQEAFVAATGADDLKGAESAYQKQVYGVPSHGYGRYQGGYYGHGYGYNGYPGYVGYANNGYQGSVYPSYRYQNNQVGNSANGLYVNDSNGFARFYFTS